MIMTKPDMNEYLDTPPTLADLELVQRWRERWEQEDRERIYQEMMKPLYHEMYLRYGKLPIDDE